MATMSAWHVYFSCYNLGSVEKFLEPPPLFNVVLLQSSTFVEQIKQHCLGVGGLYCAESAV